jgi:hypothetical protein
MSTDTYKNTIYVSDIPMTKEGLSVSFWLRINSCSSCNFYNEVWGETIWTFGGLRGWHLGGTGWGLAMQYTYNSISSNVYNWQVFGGQHETDFRNFVNVWHHHDRTGHRRLVTWQRSVSGHPLVFILVEGKPGVWVKHYLLFFSVNRQVILP